MQIEAMIEKFTPINGGVYYAMLLLKSDARKTIVLVPCAISGQYKAIVSSLFQTEGISTFYIKETDKELVFELDSVDLPF